MQSAPIIETTIENDPTATPEQKRQIRAIIHGGQKKRRLVTTKRACSANDDCHPITLRRLAKRGILHPVYYSRRKVRWDLDEVEAFANNGIEMASEAAAGAAQ